MGIIEEKYAYYPSLENRGVLISGGGSGIGAEIVRCFAKQGGKVGFVDIDDSSSMELIKQLQSAGVKHAPIYHKVDVTDIDTYIDSIKCFEDELGGIYTLVNNAANDQRHSIVDITPEYWRSQIAVNLDHQFFAAQAVSEGMKSRGRGAIINMGSCSWRLGLGQLSAYVTAKAAIEGLTNGMARELGSEDIRVNCVIPGFIKTDRQVKLWLTSELEKTILDGQCLKELIEPKYVSNIVSFLASDDARMCSSGTYTVDGGWI
tara:strand:+ start:158 stop:940 length:783 start_codon:yes stop_codon:yes gene_type:complete